MFVPRALRLKGVKELQKSKQRSAGRLESAATKNDSKDEDVLIEAMQKTSTTSPAPQPEATESKNATRGPRFTTAPVTPEYNFQLAAGVELIFTDYAHQESESAQWLQQRYREVDGEEKFIHLTAILEHNNITTLKPEATQVLLRQALQQYASSALELSSNGFHVRRRPSSYPLAFVPPNSFNVVNDDGLTFWDQRTIYVEPHIRHLCKTPAKVAHWLTEHGKLKAKWLPIQAVQMLYNSCAFVVISGNVTHEDAWNKWRDHGMPEDWKIMTKVEHTKRTDEYVALLNKNKADLKRERKALNGIKVAEEYSATDTLNGAVDEGEGKTEQKRKKKRKRKSSQGDHNPESTNDARTSKRRA